MRNTRTGRASGSGSSSSNATPRSIGTVAVLFLGGFALLAAFVISGVPLSTPVAHAASGRLRVDPATQNVAGAQKFTVSIIQTADVPTSGVQTNFVFDARLLRITGVEAGPPWRGAQFLFGSQTQGTNGDVGAAVSAANRSGEFLNVTTFILPGTGAPVPAGDAVFLKLTLQALGPAGTSPLKLEPRGQVDASQCAAPPCFLSPIEMIDAEGQTIPVTTQGGSVTIAGGSQAPPEGATEVAPTATLMSTVDAAARSQGATLTIAPAASAIDVGATTKVNLKVKVPVEASGVQADLAFDHDVLSIEKVEAAGKWAAGQVVAGTSGQSMSAAITDANKSGVLKGVGVVFAPGAGSVPAGEDTFLTLTVKGLDDGKSTLKASNIEVLDVEGTSVTVSAKEATLTIGDGGGGGGGSSSMMWMGLIAGVVVVAGVGGAGYWFIRNRGS